METSKITWKFTFSRHIPHYLTHISLSTVWGRDSNGYEAKLWARWAIFLSCLHNQMCGLGQGSFPLILFVLGELNKIEKSKVHSKLLRMLALSISLCVCVCIWKHHVYMTWRKNGSNGKSYSLISLLVGTMFKLSRIYLTW